MGFEVTEEVIGWRGEVKGVTGVGSGGGFGEEGGRLLQFS